MINMTAKLFSGGLSNNLYTDKLLIPKDMFIEIREGYLVGKAKTTEVREESIDKFVLEDFLSLSEGKPEYILDFARKWGMLGLCKHGLPASHDLPTISIEEFNKQEICHPVGRELLEDWREYARLLRALIRIATRLRKRESGSTEDWAIAGQQEESLQSDLQKQQILLSNVFSRLLYVSDIRPFIKWESFSNSVAVPFGYSPKSGLFGALALQALFIVTNKSMVACAECGDIFEPERRPREGEQSYCIICGRAAAMREASRRYRSRQKQKIKK